MSRPSDPARAVAEQALLVRLRAGDDDAFAELVRAHAGRMLLLARRLLRDSQHAEDAVQDAFLAAFRAIDGFDGRALLGTWLHRIVVNSCLMRLRRAEPAAASIDALLPAFRADGRHDPAPAAWPDPRASHAETLALRDAVQRALDRLPAVYRAAVVLRDLEGLDSAEAAAALGIGEDALRQRLHRGRQALAKLLEPTMMGGAL
jgi:RNA polymerase sigma-70 factor (ECF subfamily)